MAHGGYARRRIAERRPLDRRSKGMGLDKRRNKLKRVSIKNQIRSVERFLRKDLHDEVRKAQEKKLEELKQQQELQARLELEHKIRLRDKKLKFFERRKVERMIRRLEKRQRTSSDHASDERILDQLSKLKEDLNYVRFFPKTEKYVSLFVGGDNPAIVDKRNKLRQQVKANLIAAAASGMDLEETASDDDALDGSEDDFFSSGSSTDEAEADDEWTDRNISMQELRNTRSRAEDAASEKDDTGRESTGLVHPRDEMLRKSTPVDEKDVRDVRGTRSRIGSLLEEKIGKWVRVTPIPVGRNHTGYRSNKRAKGGCKC